MAATLTPRVARIHYDSKLGTWHLHQTDLTRNTAGTYRPEELVRDFATFAELLIELLNFWLLASPATYKAVNAPFGNMAGLLHPTAFALPEGDVPVTPDTAVG